MDRRDELRRLMQAEDLPTFAEILGRPAWMADAACCGRANAA